MDSLLIVRVLAAGFFFHLVQTWYHSLFTIPIPPSPQSRQAMVPSCPNVEYGPVPSQPMAKPDQRGCCIVLVSSFLLSLYFSRIIGTKLPLRFWLRHLQRLLHFPVLVRDRCRCTTSPALASSVPPRSASASVFCYCLFCVSICFGCNCGSSFIPRSGSNVIMQSTLRHFVFVSRTVPGHTRIVQCTVQHHA